MVRSRLLCSSLLVAVSSLTSFSVATAQESSASQIEEVVVTARKREETLQTVPVAVTALGGQALEDQGIDSPLDLDRIAPSLTAVNGPADPSGVVYSLRGQTGGTFQVNQSGPVAVYQDGVNIAHPTGQSAGYLDVVRVEVLNGPQGTLYGRNSTGGAINVITRDADYAGVHGFIQGELGNFNHRKLTGAVNYPIIDDVLTARLTGLYWYREGFGESVITGQDLGEDKNDIDLRLSVSFDPIPTLQVKFKAEYVDLDRNGEVNNIRYTDARYPANVLPAVQSIGFQNYAVNTFNDRRNPANPNAASAPNTQAQARLDAGTAGAALLQPYLDAVGKDLYKSFTPFETYDQVEVWFGALDIGWDISDTIRFRALSGYRQFAEYRVTDGAGSAFYLSDNGWGEAGAGPAGIGSICAHGAGTANPTNCFAPPFAAEPWNQSEFFSQEFNLSGETWEGKFDWLVGLYGSWDDMSSTQHPASRIGGRTFNAANAASSSRTLGGLPVTDPGGAGSAASVTNAVNASAASFPTQGFVSFDGDAIQSTWGLFTQNDLKFTDELSLTFGVRYGEERQQQNASFSALARLPTGTYNWLCFAGPRAGTLQATEDGCKVKQGGEAGKFSGTAYTLSLNYQATPSTLMYAKTSKGFRGGGFNISAPGANPVRLETATDYELGLKTDLLDRRLRANIAIYQTNYQNKVETRLNVTPQGVSQLVTDNAAEARIRGFEGQFFAFPIDGLSLSATLTYIDAAYVDYPGAIIPGDSSVLPAPIVGRSQNGGGVSFADPKWRYGLGARYEMPFWQGELSGQLDYSWRSHAVQTRLNRDPSVPQAIQDSFGEARGLLNGSINYDLEDRGLSFALWAQNLTNEEYQQAGVPASLYTGTGTGFTAPPLMWGVTVKKTFGDE